MRSYLKIPSLIMDGRRHSCGIIIFSNCQGFLKISIKRKSGIIVTVASKPHYSSQWINVSCLSKRYIHLFSACFAPFSVFCCQSGFFLPEIWYQDFAMASLSMTATLVGLTPLFSKCMWWWIWEWRLKKQQREESYRKKSWACTIRLATFPSTLYQN